MPRKSKVTVRYQKASRTPSARRKAPQVMREPGGVSALTRYIEENSDTGISVQELIEQFQEYDCEHPKEAQQVMAAGSWYQFVRCNNCHRIEKKVTKRD